MAAVKINNKNYDVPELSFGHMKAMEKITGESIIEVFQKEQIFLIAEAFVGAVAGCGADEADRLLEQHILGGGDISEIYKAFVDAVNESTFFKKLLGIEEETKKPIQKKSEQTAE